MINKFQQGGMAPQQGGGILALIQLLPQDQQQLIMQAFSQWAQQKGIDPNLLQDPSALELALGQFMQEMQAQQTQAAKHGAKLQFIKNLKHLCGPDEHLEYFAKGGAIGCNCVKNKKGGTMEPKKNALQQFKDKKKKVLLEKDCGGAKMKKHQIGGTLETLRQSLGLEKKNLSKFQNGGELPTAQKVEDRYKGGRRVTNSSSYFGDSISVRGVESLAPWYKLPAQIVEHIRHSKVSPMFNDTTYAERPSFFNPVKSVIRAAGNNYYSGKKQRHMMPIIGGFFNNNYEKSSPLEAAEYETLKRRFNTAWNLAK